MKAALIAALLSGLIAAALLISSGALTGTADGPPSRQPKPAELEATDRARIADTFGKLALSFIDNRGQAGRFTPLVRESVGSKHKILTMHTTCHIGWQKGRAL